MAGANARQFVRLRSVLVDGVRALFHTGPGGSRVSIGLDSPAFQQHLKQLKLRLHPDRVAAHPEARQANEQSFKVLSQYLDDLRGDGSNPGEQYRLDFYVKSAGSTMPAWQDLTVNESAIHASAQFMQDPRYWQPGQEVLDSPLTRPQHQAPALENRMPGASQDGSQPELRRLSIRLPPPPPHAAAHLPTAVRRAFRRLFAALQLEEIFHEDESAAVDRTKREVTAEALTDFLPDAIELARQGEAVRHSLPTQQLQSIRSAFWLSRRIRVVFDGAAETQPPQARVALLETLARALDCCGNGALQKCTITVGEGVGMDVLGRVWLPFDREGVWPETLAAVDVGVVWARRRHFEKLREVEGRAAVALGVASVFTTHRLSLSTAYLDFLQRLEDYSAEGGAVLVDTALLSVCAMPAADLLDMTMLRETGVVQASVNSSAQEIWTFLTERGPAVVDALQRKRVAERGLRDLCRRVELRLRLKQLIRGSHLSADEFEKGCYRMLEYQEFLRKYVEGSAVQLDNRNYIIPGQHVISIAWDFQM